MSFLDRLRFKKKPFKDTKDVKAVEGKAKIEKVKSESTVSNKEVSAKSATPVLAPISISQVLLRPHLSEKSAILQEKGQYVFEVAPTAVAHSIVQAVTALYGIKPVRVNIIKTKGRTVRYGRTVGTTKTMKRAIVTLPAGKKIDIYQ